MIPRLHETRPLGKDAGIAQPRDHSLDDPCTWVLELLKTFLLASAFGNSTSEASQPEPAPDGDMLSLPFCLLNTQVSDSNNAERGRGGPTSVSILRFPLPRKTRSEDLKFGFRRLS